MNASEFVSSIDPEIEKIIQSKLAGIERDFRVRILFAIESGSRAWGFPSPDSDYDVRFVYAHETDWYLSLQPGRDVIELPLEGDWDINGWDIRKALNLLMKPNPVMLEWLSSPIRYRWSDEPCRQLIEFARRTTFGRACGHHYRNIARLQWQKHIGDRTDINYKKYFYALRPALVIHWIRTLPTVPPPMNLQALVTGLPLEESLIGEIDRLLALKSRAKETGTGRRIAAIDDYIQAQLDWDADTGKSGSSEDLLTECEALFRAIVKGELR